MRRTVALVALLAVAVLTASVALGQGTDATLHLPALGGAGQGQPTGLPTTPSSVPPTPEPTSDIPTETPVEDCSAMPPPAYHMNDVVISLDRGACFGFCPEYSVKIEGNGHVTYEGRRNVQEIGTRTDDIPRDEVVALLQQFYDVDYFAYRARYEQELHLEVDLAGNVVQHEGFVTDLPGYAVHLQIASYVKDVWDYWNAPPELRALEDQIDATAGTEQWVGRRP